MDSTHVRELEERIEEAIAEIFRGKRVSKSLPLAPSRPIFEMMAKAATAVYEAAVEAAKKPH